jgi:predicted anti-sigma-YlaC factor YlaD
VTAAARTTASQAVRERGWPVVRALLLAVGLVQLLASLPALLFGADTTAGVHLAHEAGAGDVALAVGVLAAAWQPWRAAGMLPVVLVLAVGLGATSAADVAAGHVAAWHEAPHLLALAEVLLLVLLRRRSGRTPDRSRRGIASTVSPELRVVGDDSARSA